MPLWPHNPPTVTHLILGEGRWGLAGGSLGDVGAQGARWEAAGGPLGAAGGLWRPQGAPGRKYFFYGAK